MERPFAYYVGETAGSNPSAVVAAYDGAGRLLGRAGIPNGGAGEAGFLPQQGCEVEQPYERPVEFVTLPLPAAAREAFAALRRPQRARRPSVASAAPNRRRAAAAAGLWRGRRRSDPTAAGGGGALSRRRASRRVPAAPRRAPAHDAPAAAARDRAAGRRVGAQMGGGRLADARRSQRAAAGVDPGRRAGGSACTGPEDCPATRSLISGIVPDEVAAVELRYGRDGARASAAVAGQLLRRGAAGRDRRRAEGAAGLARRRRARGAASLGGRMRGARRRCPELLLGPALDQLLLERRERQLVAALERAGRPAPASSPTPVRTLPISGGTSAAADAAAAGGSVWLAMASKIAGVRRPRTGRSTAVARRGGGAAQRGAGASSALRSSRSAASSSASSTPSCLSTSQESHMPTANSGNPIATFATPSATTAPSDVERQLDRQARREDADPDPRHVRVDPHPPRISAPAHAAAARRRRARRRRSASAAGSIRRAPIT